MKISDYAKAQGWLKRHASSENSAGEWEKYVALNTTPELDEAIKTIDDKFGPETVFPASEAPIPPMTDTQRIMEFNERNPYSDGQLVTPSADGSRPGYAGVYKRKDQRNAWRVMGERGGINVAKWLKSQGLESTYKNKKAADAAYQKFLDANPDKLSDVTKAKWMKEGETLATKFNTLVQKNFDAGDMSKTPSWEAFLKKQKLKHAGVGTYQAQRVNLGAVDISPIKRQLADKLIDEASKDLKYKPWMEIQRKLSPSADINTSIWREYIDKHNKINGQSAKVKQAFDYLKNNDVALKIPKNLSKTMAQEGSLLRKAIFGLTGVNTRGIREGLAGLDEATKSQIAFADKGTLWTEGQGRTLTEILDDAAYRMDGNISWSSDIKKLAGRPNKNAFDYALRNFNYYGKQGKVGQIQFYYKTDKGMKNPIKWDEIEWDNKGGKKLKPSKVFFVDSTDPNNTQWTTEKIDADHANWKNKKPTVGLLDELYQAKDVYDNLLNTEVTDPRNPKGAKVKFGKIMTDVYGEGYDNFGNPYAIEHGDTVAKSPWKNLRIAEQRINSALYNITRKKGISKGVRKQIINQLNKQTYNVFDEDVITKITEGQKPVIKSVLSEGKKYDQPVLNKMLEDILGPEWCGTKAADGGRIGFSTGSGCPTEEKMKNFQEAKNRITGGEGTLADKAKMRKTNSKVLDMGDKIKDIGKFLRRGVQGVIGGAGTLIGGPIGALIEGAIEGGVYDYYRGKGYNDEQALAETLIPGLVKGRPEGVPWYGGAEELIEKEKIGTRWDPSGKVNAAAKYADAKSRYDEELDKYNLINANMTTYANVADWEKDLNAQAKILKDLEPSIKPGTPEYEAYQTAEERQTALMDQRARDYKSKNKFFGLEWDLSPAQIKQQTPSPFMQEQKQKDRYKAMDKYKTTSWGDPMKDFTLKPGERFNWDAVGFGGEQGIKDKWQQIYEIGGMDLLDKIGIAGGVSKMSSGGIAGVKKVDPNELKEAQEKMKKLMKQYKNKNLDWDAVKKSYKIWTK